MFVSNNEKTLFKIAQKRENEGKKKRGHLKTDTKILYVNIFVFDLEAKMLSDYEHTNGRAHRKY